MLIVNELRARSTPIRVALVGTGFMGKAIALQIARTPGLSLSLVSSRHRDRAAATIFGVNGTAGTFCADTESASVEVANGGIAVTTEPGLAGATEGIDVVLDATGDVARGIVEAESAIAGGKHFVSFNAETDATFGPLLAAKARARQVVYTYGDGDQPGVLGRVADECQLFGLEVRGAFNCKGFLDRKATPDSIAQWCVKNGGTSRRMTCAFTDGTKINFEQTVFANARGAVPVRRGMIGVDTKLASAVDDVVAKVLSRTDEAVVDYTLGGDFGGGVFIIGHTAEGFDQNYLRYLKMGRGPFYLFFRPYHLCHFELALSVAEAAIYKHANLAPKGAPVAATVAVAKKRLCPGDVLDGIGGFTVYGEIERWRGSRELLPMAIAEGARVTRSVKEGDVILVSDVEFDETRTEVRAWRELLSLFK